MNAIQLKQIRTLLFLSCADAAELIGNCEVRTWQRWEKGDRQIPLDVATTVSMLSLSLYERITQGVDENSAESRYFDSYHEYKVAGGTGTHIMWHLAQATSAQLELRRAALSWADQ